MASRLTHDNDNTPDRLIVTKDTATKKSKKTETVLDSAASDLSKLQESRQAMVNKLSDAIADLLDPDMIMFDAMQDAASKLEDRNSGFNLIDSLGNPFAGLTIESDSHRQIKPMNLPEIKGVAE
jgi:hypothetical protein